MDPSTWMDPYSHLRKNPSQLSTTNDYPYQITTNNGRNSHHHMSTASSLSNNCQKNQNANKTHKHHHQQQHHQQQQQQQSQINHYASNLNPNDQSFINGHYRPSNCSSWLFNSRQQHGDHDNSIHSLKNHSQHSDASSAQMSSFQSPPFANLPHHPGVYDPNFMSTSFHQTSKSNNYLSSMAAATEFVDQMKIKTNEAQMNGYHRNTDGTSSYCQPTTTTTKGFHMNDTSYNNANLSTGGFFPSHHSLATNGWHHQNHLMPPNNNSHNGMFQHNPVSNYPQQASNRSTTNSSGVHSNNRNLHNVSSSFNTSATGSVLCPNNSHDKVASNLSKCPQTTESPHETSQMSNQINNSSNSVCRSYKNHQNLTPPFASNMSHSSNNPYLMPPNLSSMNGSGQNSFVSDPSLGAKFAAAAHHDPYLAFAAAQAINTQAEYAAFQQQQQQQQSNPHKHSQYAAMNNYPNSCRSATDNYSTFPTGFAKSNRQHQNFIDYCSTSSLFPVSHADLSTNASALKEHSSFFEKSYYNSMSQMQEVQTPKPKTRKTSQKSGSKQTPSIVPVTNSFNEFSGANSCTTNDQMIIHNQCCLTQNNQNSSRNNNQTHSRCSSVASVHHGQAALSSNDSYSYNYPSPAPNNNIAVHSPYQQRSSTSNSSHSSINSCALSGNSGQEYINYGTPNSAPPTVFPTMGNSQTPTPTPGYPTPPSSVGHSNSRCNSNEELSPYSNNSMSSNISHQSYGRNDYNKSTSSCSSQISPKQVNEVSSMSDNLQFSSCMVAATQQNSQSNQQQQASPSLYSSSVLDNSYKSPQFYPNQMNSNGPMSSDSQETYSNYSSKDASMVQLPPDQNVSVEDANVLSMSTSNSYDYSQNSYGHTYPDTTTNGEKAELSVCTKESEQSTGQGQQMQSSSPSSHIISHHSEAVNQTNYRPNLTTSSEDDFDLSFESVIQPIDLPPQPSEQQEIQTATVSNLAEPSSNNLIPMNTLDDHKTSFESIENLNFVDSTPSNNSSNKQDDFTISQDDNQNQSTPESQPKLEECEPMNYPSSHENDPHIMNETNTIECNQMVSLMESIPKSNDDDENSHCLSTQKDENDDNEMLSTVATNNNADNFLSDLAPLMNDNSKIALMESTFKSDQSIEPVASSTPFDKTLPNTIFDDIQKIDNQLSTPTYSSGSNKPDDDDNQFRDVDEFLKNNFKESPENEVSNILNENKNEVLSNDQNILTEVQQQTTPETLPSTNDQDLLKCEDIKEEPIEVECEKNVKSPTNKESCETVDKPTVVSTLKSNDEKVVVPQIKVKKSSKRKAIDRPSESGYSQKKKPKLKGKSAIKLIVESIVSQPENIVKEFKSKEEKIKQSLTHSNKSKKSKTSSPSQVVERPSVISVDSIPNKSNKKSVQESSAKINSVKASPKKEAPKVSNLVNEAKTKNKKMENKATLLKSKSNVKSIDSGSTKSENKKVKETKTSFGINLNSDIKENVNKNIVAKSKVPETIVAKPSNGSSTFVNISDIKNKITVIPQKSTTTKSCSNKKCVTSVKKPSLKNSISMEKKSPQIPNNSATKPCLNKTPVSLVTNNANALLSPSLITNTGTPCIQKPPSVNPATLTNVTPTLIVNPNHSSYQVSPMTNAVLISIHPANPTPIPSLTAQSFITLNTQTVTSTTSTSNTTTTCSSQSSRRRSQDKKVSTVREGLMRTGDFVVSEEESHLELPVIWRIEGKSLLQRFEPSEQNGVTVYINTSSYSAWNPTVRQKYLGLDVRIMGCNRTRIVVEKIGLTQNKNEIRDSSSLNEKENNSSIAECSPPNIIDHLENFEVLIQTLVSQVLDPNFIAEIVKENDEYFLSHMQIIEDICQKRRSRFIAKIKWDSGILKSFETYPNIQIHKQTNVGDLRCRSCHDNWSTKTLYFEGEPYNRDTFEKLSNTETNTTDNSKKVKIAACDSCTEKIFLYSKLYHHRHNFFLCCKTKVDEIQTNYPNKESHIILDECLQDSDWMKKLFQELETILCSSDNIS